MQQDKMLVAGLAVAVFVVFALAAALLATDVLVRVALVVAGAAMSAGSWLLLTSLNMPRHVAAIDLEALAGADPTLKESAQAVNDMAGRIDAACEADEPRGIAAESRRLRSVVASMAEIVELPEFASAGADEDRHLVLSLATSWLPGAWEQLVTNVRYLSFGGLDRMRTNIVEGASVQVETGSEYLRQRLGRRPSELSLEEPNER